MLIADILVHSSEAEQDIMDHYEYSEYMKEKGPIKELKLFQENCPEDYSFLSDWSGSSLCIQRNEDFYYTKSSECSSEYQMCNPGLCVLKSEGCPITGVSQANMSLTDLEVEKRPGHPPILHILHALKAFKYCTEWGNDLYKFCDDQFPT